MKSFFDQLRQSLTLFMIKIARRWLKNTRLESSFFVNALYKIVFAFGFQGAPPEKKFIFHGQNFIASSKDKTMLPGLLNQTYELHELSFFKKTLKPGWVILDIGANIGLYSKIASTIIGANGHVYCFEPTPATRLFLEKNLSACANTTIVPKAVGAKSGLISLYLEKENLGCNSLLAKTGEAIEVQMTSIDDFLIDNSQIQRVDFIKIDIEGFEEEALLGMDKTLKYHPLLMIELNPSFLRQHGRKPEVFLQSLHRRFKKVTYICEKTGELLPLRELKDLGHQLIANVVLENPHGSP